MAGSQLVVGPAAMTVALAPSCSPWVGRFVARSSISTSASGWVLNRAARRLVGPVVGEEAGRIRTCVEGDGLWVEVVGCEDPEIFLGGDAAGKVAVGGDDRIDTQFGELGGLFAGEGGAQGCDAEVGAGGGQGDGDGVHGSFDHDGDRPGSHVRVTDSK